MRPDPAQRRFVSPAVEDLLATVKDAIADPELAMVFENCFPNTLDTTVFHGDLPDGRPDSFVITGDIDAMWLRDSAAQVRPYLPLAREDEGLRRMIAGVVGRQARNVLLDSYANAFYATPRLGDWADDRTEMWPGVHERKWEIDSLAYFLRLSHEFWQATRDLSPFDGEWQAAAGLVVATLRQEQRSPFETDGAPYRFRRLCDFGDSLANEGRGDPSRRCGLVRSAFRPSDDQCKLPFLIPSNLMAVSALCGLAELQLALGDARSAADAAALADEIADAVAAHAIVEHADHGPIWAYEIDGFGGTVLMDDANAPSLLSLPYLGACTAGDPVYRNTRAFCLSTANPYFVRGKAAEGVGSPHTGQGTIWPMSILFRALTATDDAEILNCLAMLRATHAGTGFMHESFAADDPARFTRSWFAWANTLFGELIVELWHHRPHLLNHRF
jgi:uncharacterized protein